jgi:16S rRNA (guanine527-N7)-methyltransferase
MTPEAALDRGVRELAVALPIAAKDKLQQYAALLAKWNKTYNLTAIRDTREIVVQHLLDSLAVLPHLPVAPLGTLADIGSGSGAPGLPLAIARPDWQVTLNDASGKKSAFLRQAAIELELGNVSVHEGRAELWRPASGFQVVISRAFAELSLFIQTCRHLVAARGWLAAMKGVSPEAELRAVPADCDCSRVIPIKVPLLEAARHLVLCQART